MKFYVSIDIGGTSIKHGILDENIKFITSGEVATEAQKGGKNILEKVINIVSEYKKEYTLSGICISTAGMVDCEKGENNTCFRFNTKLYRNTNQKNS
ncbi:ROK family protein [Clostridium butyricum]